MSERKRISFLAFFLIWAKVQGWTVPDLHVRICHWLEHCQDPMRVLQVFRGAAKSTIYAVYKAWQLYCDGTWVSLIWAADGGLAKKLTRDTINVLRRHPLCGGMLPTKPGAQAFWVSGVTDPRNASMTAVGVDQNVTSARARDIDYDDVEVPKNIKTPEARENLRAKIQEATFILVPGGQETYIGTPHTHDSIYPEMIAAGAASLTIPLFEDSVRYEKTDQKTAYDIPFTPGPDGIYVFLGIYKHARLLVEDRDYRLEGGQVVFAKPRAALCSTFTDDAHGRSDSPAARSSCAARKPGRSTTGTASISCTPSQSRNRAWTRVKSRPTTCTRAWKRQIARCAWCWAPCRL